MKATIRPPLEPDAVCPQPRKRIDRRAVESHFEVQVWPGRVARGTHSRDELSGAYVFARMNEERRHVPVRGHDAVAVHHGMADGDEFAVAVLRAGERHGPWCRGVDGGAIAAAEVDALVQPPPPHAEARRDRTAVRSDPSLFRVPCVLSAV